MAGFAIVEFIRQVAPTVAYVSTIEDNCPRSATTESAPNSSVVLKAPLTPKEQPGYGFTLMWRMLLPSVSTSAWVINKNSRANHYYARNRPAANYVKLSGFPETTRFEVITLRAPLSRNSPPAHRNFHLKEKHRLAFYQAGPNLPKLVVSLRQYSRQMFLHDLLAGITVGFGQLCRLPWRSPASPFRSHPAQA